LAPLGEQSLKLVFYRITDRLRSARPRSGLAFKNGITVLKQPEQLMQIIVVKLE
jgi:hypothetical protein